MGLLRRIVAAVLMAVPAWGHDLCAGDCDGDGAVLRFEIEALIDDIFTASTRRCPPGSATNANAADLVAAIRNAISGVSVCPVPSTPTPTPPRVATATATASISVPDSQWTALAPLAAGPRQEVGVAELNGEIFVIGGFAPGVTDRVEAYDIAQDRWRVIAPLPQALHHVGAATANGTVYAIGGLAGFTFTPVRSVYAYVATEDRWQPVADLPTARGALAVGVVAGQIHAIGGSGSSGSVDQHAAYDPAGDQWRLLAPLPVRLNHLAAAVIDDELYVVGGRDNGNSAALHRYESAEDRWQQLAPMPTARSGLAAVELNGRLVVMGGEVNDANPPTRVFPQVEIYDPSADAWIAIAPMAVPRHGIGAVTVGGLIYVPGGATRAAFAPTNRNDSLSIVW